MSWTPHFLINREQFESACKLRFKDKSAETARYDLEDKEETAEESFLKETKKLEQERQAEEKTLREKAKALSGVSHEDQELLLYAWLNKLKEKFKSKLETAKGQKESSKNWRNTLGYVLDVWQDVVDNKAELCKIRGVEYIYEGTEFSSKAYAFKDFCTRNKIEHYILGG